MPRDLDVDVFVTSGERCFKPLSLLVGESFLRSTEGVADPVERVVLATSMPEGLLLDASSDFVDGGGAELDNMERIQHGDGVFELVIDGVLVAVEGIQSGHGDT